jgi:hypothetical protein
MGEIAPVLGQIDLYSEKLSRPNSVYQEIVSRLAGKEIQVFPPGKVFPPGTVPERPSSSVWSFRACHC